MSQIPRRDPCLPADPPADPTLADLGEWELIRRLGAFAPPGQFADDAALLSLSSDGAGELVINTDVLVEGLHFSEGTTSAADVGWRAAAANLSDLAAMGCWQALGITVGLVAPPRTSWSWVEGVYRGLSEALEHHGGVLLGGDCSGGDQRLLAITALGRLPANDCPIRRSDGQAGDWLVCTGAHGLSRLGLALLQGELDEAQALAEPLIKRAIAAHQRPRPRFDAVRMLHASRPSGQRWRVGGCDSSDGLAAAIAAIATASGCAARLDRSQLPLDPAMASLAQAQAWCLQGGEDFELVLALPEAWAKALLAALPGSHRIGDLRSGKAGELNWSDGKAWTGTGTGFEHFRPHSGAP